MSSTKTTTPASTTVKVSTISGAAKDDLFTASEDTASLNLNVLANDPGSAKIWSLDQKALTAAAGSQQPLVLTEATLGSGARISINSDGTVKYVGVTATLQALPEGKIFTDSFQYTIRMANGALSTAQANVSITGVNDAATFDDAITGGLTEDGTSTDGKLTVSDVDTGEESMQVGPYSGTLGSLTMETDGTWVYTLTTNMNSLAAGETATDKVTVKASDGTTQDIELTITGVNDAATFTGDKTGGLTEDGTSTGGKLTVTDVDHDQSSMQAGNTDGTLGSLTMETDGTWVYTLTSNMDSLAEGEEATDTVTVESLDGTTQDIELTITGVNDVAEFGGTAIGSVQEDGTTSASGTVSVVDLDHDQSAVESTGNLAGTYGDFTFDLDTGAWTYALRNTDTNVQALTSTSSVEEKLLLTSIDGTTSNLVITIGGQNEVVVTDPDTDTNTDTAYRWNLNKQNVTRVAGGLNTDVEDGVATITGFDGDDMLHLAGLTKAGTAFIQVGDYDNDNSADDTLLTFDVNGPKPEQIELVLIGYTGFTEAQLVNA